MRLADGIQLLSERPDTRDFALFRDSIDPALIEEALAATKAASVRRRRLPAEQVVWLVIGMALLRDRPIWEVVDRLHLTLDGAPLAPSSVAEARARLGNEPLEWLFNKTACKWAHESAARLRWRGLALYGLDGTALTVADTDENVAEFGRSNSRLGESAFPLVRLVGLFALRSHLVAGASFGAYNHSEHHYAASLWSELPEDSLTIVDRGFFSVEVLNRIAPRGTSRHWLIRAKSNTRMRVLKSLGPGDDLVEMKTSPQARKQNSSLPDTWVARAIQYQRNGFRPQRLLTSLLDPKSHPAHELAELYHERWEVELAYDELKTHMNGGPQSTLRSKAPERVKQELWGLLLAYNLVRLEMERIADEVEVAPTRMSFSAVFSLICDEWLWIARSRFPGAIPRQLRQLREGVKRRLVLPPRRERSYPRAVRTKSRYAYKRP
jgi:hypothetical protein